MQHKVQVRFRRSFGILLVGIGLCWLVGCGGRARIVGRVTDEQNKPLASVQIETKPSTDYIMTTYDGSFTIERSLGQTRTYGPLLAGEYKVFFKKAGIEDGELEIKVAGDRETDLGTVVLKRRNPEVGPIGDVEPSKNLLPGEGLTLPPPKTGM